MYSILLVIIYIAFISLGLPDSILGSAWPTMYESLHVPVSYAGIVSMIIAAGTIISSIFSDKLISKLGTGLVTACSVALTAIALFGFAMSDSFYLLCLWGIPYGVGAGSVDAALNNFVALHYKSRHMSWLHCFWGVGASVGPYIMGLCLTRNLTWSAGYRVIGLIQVVLVIVLFSTLFLWKEKENNEISEHAPVQSQKLSKLLRMKNAKKILLVFFTYCALESTTGLWASSYMVLYKGIDSQTAAAWASLFYIGITFGRFLCGFIADRIGDKNMIRLGEILLFLGVGLLFLPIGKTCTLIALILIGIGCAPIYPSLIHETPLNFGAGNSQAIMGVQMASAYIGTTFMPPFFGVLADIISIQLYPIYLLFFLVIMGIVSESMHRSH